MVASDVFLLRICDRVLSCEQICAACFRKCVSACFFNFPWNSENDEDDEPVEHAQPAMPALQNGLEDVHANYSDQMESAYDVISGWASAKDPKVSAFCCRIKVAC